MTKWYLTQKKADFDEIGRKFNISPILARLIRNRDIIEDEDIHKYLYGTIEEMYDSFLLKGMDETVKIIAEKINTQASIRIIGDYDVDGICATHILLKGFRELISHSSGNSTIPNQGAKVDTVIPHRMKDGFGLNESLILEAHEAGIDTIITCDNGISAINPVKTAKELGMTIIITDHHDVPKVEKQGDGSLASCYWKQENRPPAFPPADAIVDPWLPECPYPYKNICGAMVALKVIEALFSYLKQTIPEALHEELRCFAAMATVCDVMELRDENRILVKYALKHIHKCQNIGLRALIEVCGIDAKKISIYHIGFIIGPCFNASGRLDTAERVLELLNTTDYQDAICIAGELKELNESRKEMTQKGVETAIKMVEEMFYKGEKLLHKCEEMFHTGEKMFHEGNETQLECEELLSRKPAPTLDSVLVLYLPDCHESLAGIIAGRIRERYFRPTFILTDSETQGELKGSGRSIETYHMYDELCKCSELFIKFGGHKQAAGLSIPSENFEKFREALNKNTTLNEDDFIEKINIDIALPLSYVDAKLINEFYLLEPFGIANPKPVFAQRDVTFIHGRIMGKTGRAAKYNVVDSEGKRHEILHFGDIDAFDKFLCNKFSPEQKEQLYKGYNNDSPIKISITYYPDMVTYRGVEDIRIVMKHYS